MTSVYRWQVTDMPAVTIKSGRGKPAARGAGSLCCHDIFAAQRIVKRTFLENLYEACRGETICFEHFGNIDCGSFHILRDLREKTGIPFKTWFMEKKRLILPVWHRGIHDRRDLERMEEGFIMQSLELYQHAYWDAGKNQTGMFQGKQ